MGRMVKQVTENTTHYVWYPGDSKEWQRAGYSTLGGALVFGLLWLFTRDLLLAVVVGTSVTAGITGVNFGRRDARSLIRFDNLDGIRLYEVTPADESLESVFAYLVAR